MRERVLYNPCQERTVDGVNTVVSYIRKTLRSLRKNALIVIRTARSSRKDVIKRVFYKAKLGGIAEA